MAAATTASTNGATPPDSELARLELEAKKATALKEIAEARKAALAAELPALEAKGPAGTAEIGEKAGLAGEVVIYRLLEQAVDDVAAIIKRCPGATKVLLTESRNLPAGEAAYRTVAGKLDRQERVLGVARDALSQLAATRAMPLLATALPLVIDSALSIASLFRTNLALQSRETTIGTTPLVAALARELRAAEVAVELDGFRLPADALFTRFETVQSLRDEVAGLLAELDAATVGPAGRAIETKRDQLKSAEAALGEASAADQPARRARIAELEAEIAAAETGAAPARAAADAARAAIAAFDAFATAATAGEPPALLAAALAARFHGGGITHVVYAAVEGAGSETLTRERSLRSADVAFYGAVELSFMVLDVTTSEIVAAGAWPLLGRARFSGGRVEAVERLTV